MYLFIHLAPLVGAFAIPPSYVATEITLGPGNQGLGIAISENGWVAGVSIPQGVSPAAFRYRDGQVEILPSLPGLPYAGARGVNNDGDVVGTSSTTSNLFDFTSQPWLWRNGQLLDLDPFNQGAGSWARGINSAGTVVGVIGPNGPSATRAFRYEAGNLSLVPSIPGATCQIETATAINDEGVIVGVAAPPGACSRQAAWVHSQGVTSVLPGLGGSDSAALGISNAGLVVGWSNLPSGVRHAAAWRDGSPVDLGSLGRSSEAHGVNDDGVVVGQATDLGRQPKACVWRDQQLYVLEDLTIPSGYKLSVAEAINNAGQIVANGRSSSGAAVCVLLTPRCIGDANGDGAIDGSDVAAFFDAWEAGTELSDVNADGGVDGADVSFFFQRWEAGAC